MPGGQSPVADRESPRPQLSAAARRHAEPPSAVERAPTPMGTGKLLAAAVSVVVILAGVATLIFASGVVGGADTKSETASEERIVSYATPTRIAPAAIQPDLPVNEEPPTAVVAPPTVAPAPPPIVAPPPPQAAVPPAPPPAPSTLMFDEWINAVMVIDQERNAERGRWLSAYERGDFASARQETAIQIATPSRLRAFEPPPCAATAHAQFLAAAEDWAESALFLSTWIPAATYSPEEEQELQRSTDLRASGNAKYDVFRTTLRTTCV